MERRDIFRRTLELPSVYSALQFMVGARGFRRRLVNDFLKVKPGERILDIGCGTGDILEFFPNVIYVGVDYNKKYIEFARERWGHRGRFYADDAAMLSQHGGGDFDLVCALALLHHLPDDEALSMLRGAHACLRPGGRFVAMDAMFVDGQNPIARLIAKLDRGQFVRTAEGYGKLIGAVFENYKIEAHHDMLRIPYTHSIITCYV